MPRVLTLLLEQSLWGKVGLVGGAAHMCVSSAAVSLSVHPLSSLDAPLRVVIAVRHASCGVHCAPQCAGGDAARTTGAFVLHSM